MEDKKEDNNKENNNSEISQNMSTEDKTLVEYGYITKINGELFNPEEVSILIGDPMTREITQIINFLCESYPLEAISYCIQRCYYNTFSKTSLLDKIMKYLLTKYPEGELIINNLLFAYKDNHLTAKITNVNQFNSANNDGERQLTKLVFYDPSKEGVEVKKLNYNEIFIEIDDIFIKDKDEDKENNKNIDDNNIISLDENEEQANFLCDKHHLYKRFCRRHNIIYVFNFIGFEKIKILKKKKKSKKNIEENNNYDSSCAVFYCEQKGCNSKYRYNFVSNRFLEVSPHSPCSHNIKENPPFYYKQNIDLLNEKKHITDIQLVRIGK